MTAVLPNSSLLVCKITRLSALKLLQKGSPDIGSALKEALVEGLEQAYGEADVWLGLTPTVAIAGLVAMSLAINVGHQGTELLELFTVLSTAIQEK